MRRSSRLTLPVKVGDSSSIFNDDEDNLLRHRLAGQADRGGPMAARLVGHWSGMLEWSSLALRPS